MATQPSGEVSLSVSGFRAPGAAFRVERRQAAGLSGARPLFDAVVSIYRTAAGTFG